MAKRPRNKHNRLANSDFSSGRRLPIAWRWFSTPRAATWKRLDKKASSGGMEITSSDGQARSGWRQAIRCKPGTCYRVEADVECELRGHNDASSAEKYGEHQCGFTLEVQPIPNRDAVLVHTTPFKLKTDGPLSVRAYYKTPATTRELRVTVAIHQAVGRIIIRDVRCIPIIAPEEESHPLAFPPPSHMVSPSTNPVQSACIVAQEKGVLGFASTLEEAFGPTAVTRVNPLGFTDYTCATTEALIFPNEVPPPTVRKFTDLQKLAEGRVVMISLSAFAALTRGAAKVRTIRQGQDPIHARVDWSNFVTAGFALHDAFAFASRGRIPGSFAQRQIVNTPRFRAFCRRHGIITLLSSVCETDATSHHPVALQNGHGSGTLFVMDLEPLNEAASTLEETNLGKRIIHGMLGRAHAGLGQYSVPPPTEDAFSDLWRDMSQRLDHLSIRFAANAPNRPSEVSIGSEDGSIGLLPVPRPVIRIRTGLVDGDVESFFGAWYWFRQLLGVHARSCPYARPLLQRFRIVWEPACTPWNARRGWNPPIHSPSQIKRDSCDEFISARHAAIIDVIALPTDKCRVVLHPRNPDNSRFERWLSRLFRFSNIEKAPDCGLGAKSPIANDRILLNGPEIIIDPTSFRFGAFEQVLSTEGTVVRIETPQLGPAFVAHSIEATEQTATLIEHVIGLIYGLIFVNRTRRDLTIDDFDALAPGDGLILNAAEIQTMQRLRA